MFVLSAGLLVRFTRHVDWRSLFRREYQKRGQRLRSRDKNVEKEEEEDTGHSKCRSYTKFTRDLEYHRGNSKKVNDKGRSGPKEEWLDKDAFSEAYRGSFIHVVATWEKFVQDVLKETVEIVIECLAEDELCEEVRENPCVKDLLREAFKNDSRAQAGDKTSQAKALEEFKKTLLKSCSICPIFVGKGAIDNRFKSLFQTKKCLSKIIAEMQAVKCTFFNRNIQKHDTFSLETPEIIDNVVRLHYGARCAFSHGNNKRTFQPGGALHNFPDETVFKQQIGEAPASQLYTIYKYAEKYGKKARLHYYDLLNSQRFFHALAFRMFGAISFWVYDVFKVRIWKFDPDKLVLKQEEGANN